MIHQAGPLHHGLQCCMRCGEILSDYTHAMVPVGDQLSMGWAVGALVQVEERTGFTASAVVDDPPDCPLSTEHLAANGKPIDGYPRQQA